MLRAINARAHTAKKHTSLCRAYNFLLNSFLFFRLATNLMMKMTHKKCLLSSLTKNFYCPCMHRWQRNFTLSRTVNGQSVLSCAFDSQFNLKLGKWRIRRKMIFSFSFSVSRKKKYQFYRLFGIDTREAQRRRKFHFVNGMHREHIFTQNTKWKHMILFFNFSFYKDEFYGWFITAHIWWALQHAQAHTYSHAYRPTAKLF